MRAGEPGRGEVTTLLASLRGGDRSALDRLFPLVYEELRHMARGQLRRGPAQQTLHATGLVHEAYLKLAGGAELQPENRAHFLAIAARAMRQVLLDEARARRAQKRGGDWQPTTLLDDHHQPLGLGLDEVLSLNQAIETLEPRQREVVEARFFGGMEEREIATVLGVSERTVRREWVKARAWMVRSLLSPDSPPSPAS